jgi:hypothetical protein
MTWLIVLLLVIAVVAVGAWVYTQSQTTALKRRFGPEYDRALEAHDGARRPAESDLRELARRRDALEVHPLAAPVRARYVERWREAQLRFVDEPGAAVRQADMLVVEVMRERGYPADDSDGGLALVSADHPDLVAGYRSARNAGGDTDARRAAFLRMRELFDRLVEAGDGRRRREEHVEGTPEPSAYGAVVTDEPEPEARPTRRLAVRRELSKLRGSRDGDR